MISFLLATIKIIFLLGFLIGIHETGHFLIAKLCKIKVDEFAIGFGPIIWKKQGKQTKYVLRLIPLGGFVSMEGENQRSNQEGSFSEASILKRIAIVIAGATVNILFALIVYFVLCTTEENNITTVVNNLIPNYAAETVGIQTEDEIIKIENKRVRDLTDIKEVIDKCNGQEITVTIKRNNEEKNIKIKPTEVSYKSTGIYLYDTNKKSTEIAGIVSNSVAEKQGLKTGDKIISVNGEEVKDNSEKLIKILNDSEYDVLNFKLERKGNVIDLDIVPEEQSAYYLGVEFKIADNNFKNNIYYAFWNTEDFIVSIADNLKQLFTGKTSTAQLMGPVGISEVVSKTNGFREFIYMLALISMSLGVTNLLPFPPLDGGKILFLLIEAMRKKPLKEETEVRIQLLGFTILILVSIYVTYNDVLRIF